MQRSTAIVMAADCTRQFAVINSLDIAQRPLKVSSPTETEGGAAMLDLKFADPFAVALCRAGLGVRAA